MLLKLNKKAYEANFRGRIRILIGEISKFHEIDQVVSFKEKVKCECNTTCDMDANDNTTTINYSSYPTNLTVRIDIALDKNQMVCIAEVIATLRLDAVNPKTTITPSTLAPTVITPTTISPVIPTKVDYTTTAPITSQPTSTPSQPATLTPSHTPTTNVTGTPSPITPQMRKFSIMVVIISSIVIAIASVVGLLYCWKMKIEKLVEDNNYNSISNTRNLSRIGEMSTESTIIFDDDDLIIEETIGKGSFGNGKKKSKKKKSNSKKKIKITKKQKKTKKKKKKRWQSSHCT